MVPQVYDLPAQLKNFSACRSRMESLVIWLLLCSCSGETQSHSYLCSPAEWNMQCFFSNAHTLTSTVSKLLRAEELWTMFSPALGSSCLYSCVKGTIKVDTSFKLQNYFKIKAVPLGPSWLWHWQLSGHVPTGPEGKYWMVVIVRLGWVGGWRIWRRARKRIETESRMKETDHLISV